MPHLVLYGLFRWLGIDFSVPFNSTLWQSFPPLRLGEFMIGIVLYKLYKLTPQSAYKIRPAVSFYFALILSFAVVAIFIREDRHLTHALLIPFFALMILSLSLKPKMTWFSHPWILLLGNASYAIYILHQPLKYYLLLYLSPSVLTGMIYVIAVVGLSLLSYQFIEAPINRWLINRLQPSKKI